MIKVPNFAEKLIFLVKNRSALYDYTLPEHNDRSYIEELWNEIANEMGTTNVQCRTKWSSLRNTYSRSIKNEEESIANNVRKRKSWYLSNEMEFLRNFLYHRQADKTLISQKRMNLHVEGYSTVDNKFKNTSSLTNDHDNIESQYLASEDSSDDCVITDSFSYDSNNCTIKATPSNVNEASIRESSCPQKDYQYQKAVELKDHNLTFFKSILHDIEKLSERRQRIFKQDLLLLLNNALDAQEMEI